MQRFRAALALSVLYPFPVVLLVLVVGAILTGGFFRGRSPAASEVLMQILLVPLVIGLIAAIREVVRIRPQATPGPELSRADNPQLWATVDALAANVSAVPPSRIVVIPQANAAIAQIGEHELQLGLPLLAGLTVDELCSVLAHELGHVAGGDTALSVRTLRARALLKSVRDNASPLIRWFFAFYYRLYVVASAATSRDLELRADQYAVGAAGTAVTAEAHRRMIGISLAWRHVLEERASLFEAAKARAPLHEALGIALHAHRDWLQHATEQSLAGQRANWDDTHPRTADRIAAITASPVGINSPRDDRPAFVLLGGGSRQLTDIEAELLLEPWPLLSWDEVATRAARNQLPVRMGRMVTTLAERGAIAGTTPAAVIQAARADPVALGSRLVDQPEHAVEAAREAVAIVVQGLVAQVPGMRAIITDADEFTLIAPDGSAVETQVWAADLGELRLEQRLTALGAQPDLPIDSASLPAARPRSAVLGAFTMSFVKRPQLVVQDILVCSDGLLFVPLDRPREALATGAGADQVQRHRVNELAYRLHELKAEGNEWIPVDTIAAAHLELQLGVAPYRLTIRLTNGKAKSVLFNGYAREIGLLTDHPLPALLGERFSRGKRQR